MIVQVMNVCPGLFYNPGYISDPVMKEMSSLRRNNPPAVAIQGGSGVITGTRPGDCPALIFPTPTAENGSSKNKCGTDIRDWRQIVFLAESNHLNL